MVNLKISKAMDNSLLGEIEQYLLRMTKQKRDELSVSVGDTVKIGNDNNYKLLKVGWVYEHDTECHPAFNGAFVTSQIFKQLFGVNSLEIAKVNNVTFGCDPEAFLVHSTEGHLVDAGLHFNYAAVGHDQGLLEFRPEPTFSAYDLTVSLFTYITAAQSFAPDNVEIQAMSMYAMQPAGFHIHFGVPVSEGIEPFMHTLGRLLDFFVAIPSIYFEKGLDYERRTTTVYGKPRDIRPSTHSYEYRTVGAHMLSDPRLTLLILSIAETIVKDLYVLYQEFPDIVKGNNIFKAYTTLPSDEIIKAVLKSRDAINFSKRYVWDIMATLDCIGMVNFTKYFEEIQNLVYEYHTARNWMWNTKESLDLIKRCNYEKT